MNWLTLQFGFVFLLPEQVKRFKCTFWQQARLPGLTPSRRPSPLSVPFAYDFTLQIGGENTWVGNKPTSDLFFSTFQQSGEHYLSPVGLAHLFVCLCKKAPMNAQTVNTE